MNLAAVAALSQDATKNRSVKQSWKWEGLIDVVLEGQRLKCATTMEPNRCSDYHFLDCLWETFHAAKQTQTCPTKPHHALWLPMLKLEWRLLILSQWLFLNLNLYELKKSEGAREYNTWWKPQGKVPTLWRYFKFVEVPIYLPICNLVTICLFIPRLLQTQAGCYPLPAFRSKHRSIFNIN